MERKQDFQGSNIAFLKTKSNTLQKTDTDGNTETNASSGPVTNNFKIFFSNKENLFKVPAFTYLQSNKYIFHLNFHWDSTMFNRTKTHLSKGSNNEKN